MTDSLTRDNGLISYIYLNLEQTAYIQVVHVSITTQPTAIL